MSDYPRYYLDTLELQLKVLYFMNGGAIGMEVTGTTIEKGTKDLVMKVGE
jgi:hypothetical protein